MSVVSQELPRRIVVQDVLRSRYAPGERPVSWDERFSAIEQVRTAEGEVIDLLSGGGQSTPAPGWVLLLTESSKKQESDELLAGVAWTLYGIPSSSKE